MSDRRPSPAGVRVSAGRLRVDAARAVDKLRDYQLPDPIMWVLEVVRAAVLARAESIRVYGDADDVAIAWDGAPIDPEELARLLDELVDPAPAADRRHLRLLATGVNTALGLSPRWIDVVSCDGTGEAHAVRYTTRLLERKGESGAIGLRDLKAERRGAVPHAPARGVLVHLRRPPLLSAVPILIGLGEPPELSMLRRAAADLSVPLSIGRSVLGRDRSHVDLLRIELGEGLDGFLALTDPTFAEDEGSLDVAELGVLLARYTLPLLPDGAKPRARVPLRLFVDAERMPTNASRSAVRLEDPPLCDVVARAPALLRALTARLAAELTAPAHPWTHGQGERLRAAALSLLAVATAGPTWREELAAITPTAYGEALSRLASLPLLRDALGRPRAPSSFPPRSGAMHVHFRADPLPSVLEPWLGDVLWVPPGDPSVVLLGGWRAPPAQELALRARELERARALWLREKPRPATLADDPLHLLVVPIRQPGDSLKSCVSGRFGPSAGGALSGQLALCDPRGTRTSRVSLLLEGREIESLTLELPVPIVAVVEHAGLQPGADYRSAERDEAFDAALAQVRAAAVVACEALALRMRGKRAKGDRAVVRAPWLASMDPSERAIVRELVRGGAMLALSLLGSSLEKSRSPLLTAEVWSLATGEGRCLRDIFAAIGAGPRVLRWSRARSAYGPPPGARPVFALSPAEQAAIARAAKPSSVVDYTSLVAGWAPPALSAMPAGAACRVGTEDEAVIGWGTLRGKIDVRHWGRRVAEIALLSPELSACHVQVEDGALVPGEDGEGTRGDGPGSYPLAAWHRELATAYIDALAGSPPPELTVFADDPRDATYARAGLLAAIASATPAPSSWLGTDRVETLRRIPWIQALGEREPISLDALSARFPEGPIPYVPPETHAPPGLGWHPARATPIEASAFARLLDRELVPAVDRLAERVRLARRQEALEALRREPVVRHAEGWAGPRIELKGQHVRSAVCALGSGDRAQAEVRLEGRRFVSVTLELALPVRLDVDFEESAADADLRALSPGARASLRTLAVRGARRLLRQIADRDPASLTTSPGVLALLSAWSKTIEGQSAERKLADRLLEAPAFASIQGPPVALASARSASGALRVASWDEPWLGPSEGERPSVYDAPIVRLTSSVDRALLAALHSGAPEDVTGPAGRLQTERRIARGLVKLARLEGVKDPRFRYPLRELLVDAHEASELLGFGEAALDDASRTVVTLFAAGVQRKMLDFALVPAVRVAAESPLVRSGQPLASEVEARLEDALRVVIARLVRRVVDTTPPDQLPEWVRHTLRASCLSGGALHFERLDETPMFQTTAGAWLTPKELSAQHASLGPIWWTAAALPLVPLDPARVALRLRRDEAEQLAGWLPCVDAQAELELDAKARVNRDRPPVESLEPSEVERAAALAVIELGAEPDDSCHGVILVLKPGHEGRRGLRMHRAMRPMDLLPDPCAWPALARLEDPELVPNRTWSAPEEDMRLARLRSRVSEAVRKELIRRVPYPPSTRHARRISNARVLGLAGKASVEAVVWLEASLGAGTLAVHDVRGERTIEPSRQGRSLPVSGTVWMAGAPVDGAVTTAIYRFLLEQVAREVPAEPDNDDLALAHLVHGLGLGLVARETLPPISLACFAPEPWALSRVLSILAGGARLPVAAPGDRGTTSGSEVPVLIDDGSPVARALLAMLGARVYPWRDLLRARALEQPAPMPGGAADPIPAESPRSALERRFEARLTSLSPSARVKIASRRKRPLLATEGDTFVLAGAHPIALRLRALAEADDPRLELALTLLAARVAGHQHRVAARIGKSGELDAMLRLLAP